ncbi:hypothetical protein ACFL3I_08570 [Pseudomonadota bacterium]
MKRIAFWLYQVYAWLLFIPFGLLFTFFQWMDDRAGGDDLESEVRKSSYCGKLGPRALLVNTCSGDH